MSFALRSLITVLCIMGIMTGGVCMEMCPSVEREALVVFMSGLTDQTGRLASWKGIDCCTWKGIQCHNSTGHVIKIDLRNPCPLLLFKATNGNDIVANRSSCSLNGTLNPSLFKLQHLEYLDLSYNNFHGQAIPIELASLNNLAFLNLSNAGFGGVIPQQLGNLSRLYSVDLSCAFRIRDLSSIRLNLSAENGGSVDSKVSYYPTSIIKSDGLTWVESLVNLRFLFIDGVNLGSASNRWGEAIGHLWQLRELSMSDCSLSGPIPSSILNLTDLSTLRLSFSYFFSPLPNWVQNLTNLLVLDLSKSNIQGCLPPQLPHLQYLDVSYNENLSINLTQTLQGEWPLLMFMKASNAGVRGTLHPSIDNISSLVYLDLSFNDIEGVIPYSIGNVKYLEHLDLCFNNLTGEIPSSLGFLSSLSFLILDGNKLTGSIPSELSSASSLEHVLLAMNQLTGTVPHLLNRLSRLVQLDLQINNLEGNISLSMFSNLTQLTWIDFNCNYLSVNVTETLPFTFDLQFLALHKCNIGDSFPTFIRSQKNIFYLDLGNNGLRGRIPSWLWNMKRLSCLDLSTNNLEGQLPSIIDLQLSEFPATVKLAQNRLEGPIPLFSTNMEIIDISQNRLEGRIPLQLGKSLSNAKLLSLAGNLLTGYIPTSICLCGKLEALNISDNQLSGNVPPCLGSLSALKALDISHNNFSGPLPLELGKAFNLKDLEVYDYNVSGIVPSFLRNLKALEVLNMGNANLEGRIPGWLGELSMLRILVLKSNYLVGDIPPEITGLQQLQHLDLSGNKLTGVIPANIGNLSAMVSQPRQGYPIGYVITNLLYYRVQVHMSYKGQKRLIEDVYSYRTNIDLSRNNLSGDIPPQIVLLKYLKMLNLSWNKLTGPIPEATGNMLELESLDLSHNKLAGPIPETINSLDELGKLNLAFNNLSGKIPASGHLGTFNDPSYFVGNPDLCGPPLEKTCPAYGNGSSEGNIGDEKTTKAERVLDGLWYGWVILNFGLGFWGVFAVLGVNRRWRRNYVEFMDKLVMEVCSIRGRGNV